MLADCAVRLENVVVFVHQHNVEGKGLENMGHAQVETRYYLRHSSAPSPGTRPDSAEQTGETFFSSRETARVLTGRCFILVPSAATRRGGSGLVFANYDLYGR